MLRSDSMGAGGVLAPEQQEKEVSRLPVNRDLMIVYPPLGNRFYCELADRFSEAAVGLGYATQLVTPDELADCEDWIRDSSAFVVNPVECALSSYEALGLLGRARSCTAILAECAETRWYRNQFHLGIPFDDIIDVGFVDQSHLHGFEHVRYRFLFNAPLRREATAIAAAAPAAARTFAWAMVGNSTPRRIRLSHDLLTTFGPTGFLFLPKIRPVRPGEGMLSPANLRRVLDQTGLYVWCAHHEYPYYESFRFLDAVVAGALPCKIDSGATTKASDLPPVYASVDALAERVAAGSVEELFEEHRQFALSHGTLEDRLGEVLDRDDD